MNSPDKKDYDGSDAESRPGWEGLEAGSSLRSSASSSIFADHE